MKVAFYKIAVVLMLLLPFSCAESKQHVNADSSMIYAEIENFLRSDIMKEADWAMQQMPVTVTSQGAQRSAGSKHDFFSEADYFWPDPKSPDSPYISRDGLTNPDNFVAHRKAMIRLSNIIAALASAYKLTGDQKYVQQATMHIWAWFIDTATIMNPHLEFAQAVKGRFAGRNYGIIDTIHLLEVVQGILVMNTALDAATLAGVKSWFRQYLQWLTNSEKGIAEKNIKNNHSTCWAMQAAIYAKLIGDSSMMDTCRNFYKNVLLPNQMALDGSFPLEMKRTKPYGYAIFNLDAMAALCQILSTKVDDLWEYTDSDGRSVKKAIEYLQPFVADKNKWPLSPDVMYWNDWPVAQPFLLFGAMAYHNKTWLETWKNLEHHPQVDEVIRNLPIRHPLIWF